MAVEGIVRLGGKRGEGMKPNERVCAVYQGRKPDQVPTDAPFHRIAMLPGLVAKYGGY